MNRIRAALPWKKKNYHGDSDSTGYCSSSELSKTLSDSQFILRPNTALMSSSYSNCTNYYALDYSEFSVQRSNNRNRDPKATITSRSSTISSTTFKSHTQSLSTSTNLADDEAEKDTDEDGEDEDSTVRANSVCRVTTSRASLPMMMPKLTSIKHLMRQGLDGKSDDEDLDDSEGRDAEDDDDDDDDELETIDEITTSYDLELEDGEREDDEATIDIAPFKKHHLKRREFKNSSFRSFPFSYKIVENEMDRLFDMLQVDEQRPSTSANSNPSESTIRRKRLLIKEPITKIYYHEQSTSEAPPPIPMKPTSLLRTESVPRSILKNASSFAIYEEIYGDHLTPPPTDIRPRLPERPIMAFQQFPPCTTFQPKHPQRLPSIRRRKKLPSLHHSTSFASYFRRKK